MNAAMIEQLRTRRSVKPDQLGLPAPSAAELETILTIAARVPDHKKLAPWRFLVFEGAARDAAGELFAAAALAEDKMPPSEVRLATERARFTRAPLVIAVISRVLPSAPAPEWEQVLSAGAACLNLCHAANALGYQSCWLTEWMAYSPAVKAGLNLGEHERVAGFIHLGTAKSKPEERERPDLAAIMRRWSP